MTFYEPCRSKTLFFDLNPEGGQIPNRVNRAHGPQISRAPDFQTPPAAAAPDELPDPNLTPFPTHPGIKYVARALAATKVQAIARVASRRIEKSVEKAALLLL